LNLNCTEVTPILSEALAETASAVPETVVLFAGAVIETIGAAVSGEGGGVGVTLALGGGAIFPRDAGGGLVVTGVFTDGAVGGNMILVADSSEAGVVVATLSSAGTSVAGVRTRKYTERTARMSTIPPPITITTTLFILNILSHFFVRRACTGNSSRYGQTKKTPTKEVFFIFFGGGDYRELNPN
jgi:hypothetical protein